MVSEQLQKYHDENCPKNIDINSEDFTNFLLEEISKLKTEKGD